MVHAVISPLLATVLHFDDEKMHIRQALAGQRAHRLAKRGDMGFMYVPRGL
jgi:hypothetical protein